VIPAHDPLGQIRPGERPGIGDGDHGVGGATAVGEA